MSVVVSTLQNFTAFVWSMPMPAWEGCQGAKALESKGTNIPLSLSKNNFPRLLGFVKQASHLSQVLDSTLYAPPPPLLTHRWINIGGKMKKEKGGKKRCCWYHQQEIHSAFTADPTHGRVPNSSREISGDVQMGYEVWSGLQLGSGLASKEKKAIQRKKHKRTKEQDYIQTQNIFKYKYKIQITRMAPL